MWGVGGTMGGGRWLGGSLWGVLVGGHIIMGGTSWGAQWLGGSLGGVLDVGWVGAL